MVSELSCCCVCYSKSGVEYLAKQYLQTGETIYRDMWEDVLDGIQKHLVTTTRNAALKYIAELPAGVGGALSPKMDHLVCFLPGTIAMGVSISLSALCIHI